MGEPFVASEAVAAGSLTPYRLRSTCIPIHRDLYLRRGSDLTAVTRARAAWLWSGRADAGAESPQETRVRLVLFAAGFPRPETQIPVYDEWGSSWRSSTWVGGTPR
jgi:hypothetical protein